MTLNQDALKAALQKGWPKNNCGPFEVALEAAITAYLTHMASLTPEEQVEAVAQAICNTATKRERWDIVGPILKDRFREAARAVLALPFMRVPEGWKLVPVEPTREMFGAALAKAEIPRMSATEVWQAMLATAPEDG